MLSLSLSFCHGVSLTVICQGCHSVADWLRSWVNVEQHRRVRHVLDDVRAVGSSTLFVSFCDLHGWCNSLVETHECLSSRQSTPQCQVFVFRLSLEHGDIVLQLHSVSSSKGRPGAHRFVPQMSCHCWIAASRGYDLAVVEGREGL